MDFKQKHLKYKTKYLNLKNTNLKLQIGGNINCLYVNDIAVDSEEIKSFKRKLEYRTLHGYKNWLVIYAGNYSETEKARFANSNWIFWDNKESGNERYSIRGDFNKVNLIKLDKILSNTFDYICFDDDERDYYRENKVNLTFRLLKLLKLGGILVIKNMIKAIKSDDEYISISFLSPLTTSRPHGTSYNGRTLLSKICNVLKYVKSEYIYINLLQSEIFEIFKNFNEMSVENMSMFLTCINMKFRMEECTQKFNIDMYLELKTYCDINKELLYDNYVKILAQLGELWKLPQSCIDQQEDLFIIKKIEANYPEEYYQDE